MLLKARGVDTLFFIRDGNFFYSDQYKKTSFKNFCNTFVVQNYEFKELMKKSGYLNIKVLKNFTSPTKFNSIDKKDSIDFMYVGWLTKEKGMDSLIKLIDSNFFKINFNLKIFGKGPYYEALKKRESSKIKVFGWADSETIKRNLLHNDIFLFPSLYEGMPNVVLEALSYKNAIILNDFLGSSELVLNSYNGYIVKFFDTESVISSINKIILDIDKYKLNSKDHFENNFTNLKEVKFVQKISTNTIKNHDRTYYLFEGKIK